MSNVSSILKQLRSERGLQQKEIANYLQVSTGTISNYENGVHSPDLDVLQQLARIYGVSMDYLAGLTDCQCPIETLNQVISDGYTIGQFLELLDRLDSKDKESLVWMLRKIE